MQRGKAWTGEKKYDVIKDEAKRDLYAKEKKIVGWRSCTKCATDVVFI